MTTKEELTALLSKLDAMGVKIVRKDQSRFWRFIGWCVMVITFGKNKSFLDSFTTTLHKTIAVPSSWDDYIDELKISIIEHELIHVAQFKKYTPPIFLIAYLLLPLPIGLAYFRYRFERTAYVHEAKLKLKYKPSLKTLYVNHIVEQLCGPNYGWAWPFRKSVKAWVEKELS